MFKDLLNKIQIMGRTGRISVWVIAASADSEKEANERLLASGIDVLECGENWTTIEGPKEIPKGTVILLRKFSGC